ncbi:hypothetical protein [Pedobacter frigoris]|uniref:hypothetical protein n=1 Tax=Pedobacter frigoris TaxID=2571272 RepID=UPI002930E3D1|nr:hypothetical protein [Pedobacter frigoris]
MKIDKDLIEKYHRNECTAEEASLIEEWLFSGDSDEALQLPLGEQKADHKAEMWAHINPEITDQQTAPPKRTLFNSSFWSGAIAASLVAGIVAVAGYQLVHEEPAPTRQLVSVNNTSSVNVKHLESSIYDISIGTNTSARIDNLTGVVDLAGSMLICPKQDIELLFEGSKEKVTFKGGQTYIILKGKDGRDKIIIVSEKNLMDLPPVLQKQIINEFNI